MKKINMNVIASVLFASMFAFAIAALNLNNSTTEDVVVSSPLGQTRPEAFTPAPIVVEEFEKPVIQLGEIVVLGNIPRRVPVPVVSVPEKVASWECTNWKESQFGGQYKECGWN
jgi:hypothetical protein